MINCHSPQQRDRLVQETNESDYLQKQANQRKLQLQQLEARRLVLIFNQQYIWYWILMCYMQLP